jgi:hypothetical protein
VSVLRLKLGCANYWHNRKKVNTNKEYSNRKYEKNKAQFLFQL